MEIKGGESGNVEDRRGLSGPAKAGGGIVGILVTIALVYFGVNPQQAQQFGNFAGQLANGPAEQKIERELTAKEKEVAEFYAKVVGSTNKVWREQFKENYSKPYQDPTMVLFEGSVATGCGNATSDVGPFYCPADQKLYLDPTFFDTLEKQLGGSSAKFSQSYVIAHEVGHHVQKLLGYSDIVDQKRRTSEANDASVRLELMADYLAGCWAYHAGRDNITLNESDLDSAVQSAHAIGDDKLQSRGGRTSNPDSFTHGTSAQRKANFIAGYNTGNASKARLDRFFEVRSSRDL